ncbi:hypothetical protein AVEN_238262-1, partial [Araneus ventricosus]
MGIAWVWFTLTLNPPDEALNDEVHAFASHWRMVIHNFTRTEFCLAPVSRKLSCELDTMME